VVIVFLTHSPASRLPIYCFPALPQFLLSSRIKSVDFCADIRIICFEKLVKGQGQKRMQVVLVVHKFPFTIYLQD